MTRSLPPHPSLEHLKKEAKALLRDHKQGRSEVCTRLRHLRRFAQASDEEILSAELVLAEAQFALAMDYGFQSWEKLKVHVEQTFAAPRRRTVDLSGLKLNGNVCSEDSFSMVIEAVCSLLGRPAERGDIDALAGNVFAPALRLDEPCRAWWHVQAQDRCLDLVAACLGLTVRELPRPNERDAPPAPHDASQRDRWYAEYFRKPSVAHIRQAHEAGEIVITDREWDWRHHRARWYGWGILVDARDDGTIVGACLNGRSDNPLNYPGLCRAVSASGPTLGDPQARSEILRQAVARIRSDAEPFLAGERLVSGTSAMEVWAREMETVPGFCAECQQRSQRGWSCAMDNGKLLHDGAVKAASWLRARRDAMPPDVQRHLDAAAACYDRIAALLSPAVTGDAQGRYQSFVGNLAEQKAHVKAALLPATDELARAADHMAGAVELLS